MSTPPPDFPIAFFRTILRELPDFPDIFGVPGYSAKIATERLRKYVETSSPKPRKPGKSPKKLCTRNTMNNRTGYISK